MRVRLVKRLVLDDVVRRLRALERRYRIRSEDLGRVFDMVQQGKVSLDEYLSWARLYDAYRAYVENGELNYVYEEESELTTKFASALTSKRMELLGLLARENVGSIHELARRLERNVSNVHQDLKTLEKMGFVVLQRLGGRGLVPQLLVDEISLVVR